MSEPISMLDGRVVLHHGDCRDVVAKMHRSSVDSIVTDPPYSLDSIRKRFGGENAAPAQQGTDGAFARSSRGFMGMQWDTGEVAFNVDFWRECFRVLLPGGHLLAFSGTRTYHRMAIAIEDAGFEIRDQIPFAHDADDDTRNFLMSLTDDQLQTFVKLFCENGEGQMAWCYGSGMPKSHNVEKALKKIGSSKKVTGLGTGLKPAWEPICVARKPISERSVGRNVIAHGTGAMNIDACRIMPDAGALGRWPANLIHDGSDGVINAFPDSDGQQGDVIGGSEKNNHIYGQFGTHVTSLKRSDSGSASRFFYSAKANKYDRIGSAHPTVKRVELMQWLVRLVTPQLGTVFDPFAGSGTTGIAAWLEGRNAILCEREAQYVADIQRRMSLALAGPNEKKVAITKAKNLVDHDPGPLFADAFGDVEKYHNEF